MYLLYLDESGDTHSWQHQDNFVLAGVAIFEGQIYKLTREIDAIQEKYFPGLRIPIEFHASAIRNGRDKFRRFTPDVREELLEDVYGVIDTAHFPNLVAFATCIHETAVTSPMGVRKQALEEICNGLNTFLYNKFQINLPDKGLLIIDRHREKQYLEFFDEIKRYGTSHGPIVNIVDIPYFAKCSETRMLQLADFVAHAVFRYYERNDDQHFQTIFPRFYRELRKRSPIGLRHITQVRNCRCVVCSPPRRYP